MFRDESLGYFHNTFLPSSDHLSELQSPFPERKTLFLEGKWTPPPLSLFKDGRPSNNYMKKRHPLLCTLSEWCSSSFHLKRWFGVLNGLKLPLALSRNRPESHQKASIDHVVCLSPGKSLRT